MEDTLKTNTVFAVLSCLVLGLSSPLALAEPGEDDEVTLASSDGTEFKIPFKVAKISTTIKNLIEDVGIDNSIPIQVANSIQLASIVDLLTKESKVDKEKDTDEQLHERVSAHFTNEALNAFPGLLEAINYLDIESSKTNDILTAASHVYGDRLFAIDTLEELAKSGDLTQLPNEVKKLVLDRHLALFPPVVLATFKHSKAVTSVAFSPDGQRLLTGSSDKTAKLWDANVKGYNSKPLATLKHDDWVESVAFSPDGQRLLTGSRGKTANLWLILDPSKLTNPLDAQIIAFVKKKNMAQGDLPDHLVNALSEYAKEYLGWWKLF